MLISHLEALLNFSVGAHSCRGSSVWCTNRDEKRARVAKRRKRHSWSALLRTGNSIVEGTPQRAALGNYKLEHGLEHFAGEDWLDPQLNPGAWW